MQANELQEVNCPQMTVSEILRTWSTGVDGYQYKVIGQNIYRRTSNNLEVKSLLTRDGRAWLRKAIQTL